MIGDITVAFYSCLNILILTGDFIEERDGYFELASAVVGQAIKDYRKVKRELEKMPKNKSLFYDKCLLELFSKREFSSMIAD